MALYAEQYLRYDFLIPISNRVWLCLQLSVALCGLVPMRDVAVGNNWNAARNTYFGERPVDKRPQSF
jgi:hypothetical protein